MTGTDAVPSARPVMLGCLPCTCAVATLNADSWPQREQSLASLKTPLRPDCVEAVRRLAEFDEPRRGGGREPLLLSFARQFTHFFAVTLW